MVAMNKQSGSNGVFAKTGGKLLGVLSYDSAVSQTLLNVWAVFVIAVLGWLFLLPQVAFILLVGWQPTHVAVWLGVLSLIPIGPGLTAIFAASRAVLAERGYPGHLTRTFFASIRQASRGQILVWAIASVAELFVAYDIALFGTAPSVFVPAVALAMLMAVLLMASAATEPTTPHGTVLSLREYMAAMLVVVARKVYVPLTWLFLLIVVAMLSRIPLVGSMLLLFAPGLWGLLAALVTTMFRFGATAVGER
ncbi:hypothetical protein G1C95_1619 [Bifidobacterium sp. DSM 109957]|uniref:DUF624 domain-containing protein n=2 Tax=Bifidobacterium oedipodis TaxID=2675322 RepID=A0A7Y0EQB8_9BIFI|nr:hypothetical protein [Bifidobacterium sp. DSM 109957]